jgi:hypothetical protein
MPPAQAMPPIARPVPPVMSAEPDIVSPEMPKIEAPPVIEESFDTEEEGPVEIVFETPEIRNEPVEITGTLESFPPHEPEYSPEAVQNEPLAAPEIPVIPPKTFMPSGIRPAVPAVRRDPPRPRDRPAPR